MAVLASSVGAGAPVAHADELFPEAGRSDYYGYQTVIVDVASATLALASPKLGAPAGFSALGGYLVLAPLVHVIHGRGRAFAFDLGMRLVAGGVGASLGYAAGCGLGNCNFHTRGVGDGVIGGAVGLGVGAVGAAFVDAFWLGREPAHDKARVVPSVVVTGSAATCGFSGSF